MSGELIAALVSLAVALGAYLTAQTETNKIKASRDSTKVSRDDTSTRLILKCAELERRIDENANRFTKIEEKLDRLCSSIDRFSAQFELYCKMNEGIKSDNSYKC